MLILAQKPVQTFSKALNRAKTFGWKVDSAPPADPILSIGARFKAEKDPRKVNVSVGAYRDEQGKPFVLPCVKEAIRRLHDSDFDLEYLPMGGCPDMAYLGLREALGDDSTLLKEDRIARVQSLSGGGAFYLVNRFIQNYWSGSKILHGSTPSWPIHRTMAESTGMTYKGFPYYDTETKGLDFEGMINYMRQQEDRSIFILHVCGHNPTGVDLNEAQWRQVNELFAAKGHLALFDMAYQGFATGDTEKDVYPLRLWQETGTHFILAQSFAKCMGLYGTRTGILSITTETVEQKETFQKWLAFYARNIYCSPPKLGAAIVRTILGDEELR